MSVTATGDIFPPSSGSNSIPVVVSLGTGTLTLSASGRIASFRNLTLTAGAVSLRGQISSTLSITITATTGRLTLNGPSISVGGGTLTLNVGGVSGTGVINVNAATAITAGTFEINFTNLAGATDQAAGFTIGSTNTFSLLGGTATPVFDFTNSGTVTPPTDDCATGSGDCSLTTEGGASLTTADAILESDGSITINIGSGTLTFGDAPNAIMITAATFVSITAGNIDIEGRALTITASGGALTLNTTITADEASSPVVMLSAAGGALELGGDINARGSALTLSSTGTGAGITLSGPINLDGAAITLTARLVALTPSTSCPMCSRLIAISTPARAL